MSAPEVFDDLDPKIAKALRRIVEDLRAEFRQQLGGASPAAPVGTDLVEELKRGLAAVDRGGTQSAVLSALLEGARRFASRTAIFVAGDGTLEGWAGLGFEQAVTPLGEVSLRLAAGTPWERVVRGIGTVALGSHDCEPLCEELGVPAPTVGALVPMVLGDRVAAALYCDRLEGGGSLHLSALQILTYCAAQTLETLPVRNRAETVTLRLGGGEDVATDDEATVAVARTTRAEVVPALSDAPEAELEPAEDLDEAQEDSEAPAFETDDELLPVAENVPEFEFETADETADETGLEPEDEDVLAAPAPEVVEVAPEPEESAAPPSEEPLSAGFETTRLPSLQEIGLAGQETTAPPVEPPAAPPVDTTPSPVEPTPPPSSQQQEGSGHATAKATDPGRAGTAVEPPQDVDGPGWAFTSREAGSELGEEAKHEEARRLARLLVTEIKLYNEEQVEAGRIQRDLFDRLRDDIERSRQIFDDRVDPDIRAGTDHFQEALVRILGAGDPATLGL